MTPAFTSTNKLVLVRSSQVYLRQWLIPDGISGEQVTRWTLWYRIVYRYNTIISDTILLPTIISDIVGCVLVKASQNPLLKCVQNSNTSELQYNRWGCPRMRPIGDPPLPPQQLWKIKYVGWVQLSFLVRPKRHGPHVPSVPKAKQGHTNRMCCQSQRQS